MVNLKEFIVRTRICNTDEKGKMGNSKFDTQDYIFLRTREEIEKSAEENSGIYASDNAVMNGAIQNYGTSEIFDYTYGDAGEVVTKVPKRKTTLCYSRSAASPFVYITGYNSSLAVARPYKEEISICPAMNLDADAIASMRMKFDCFKIEPKKDKNNKVLYHTIEFGSYPLYKAENGDELEELLKAGAISATGKKYPGYMEKDGTVRFNQEFALGDQKYVRVESKRYNSGNEYRDMTKAQGSGTFVWEVVSPIRWRILNYDNLQKELNPNGDGTAKTMYVEMEEAGLAGIPFYLGYDENVENTMYQNSPIRAILNGYNLHKEILNNNGNKDYMLDRNYSFEGCGFIDLIEDSEILTRTKQDEDVLGM